MPFGQPRFMHRSFVWKITSLLIIAYRFPSIRS
jgi:hypothetical protein